MTNGLVDTTYQVQRMPCAEVSKVGSPRAVDEGVVLATIAWPKPAG